MKVCEARGELRDPETHDLFGYVTLALEVDCTEMSERDRWGKIGTHSADPLQA